MNEIMSQDNNNIIKTPFQMVPEDNIGINEYKLLLYLASLTKYENTTTNKESLKLLIDYNNLYLKMGCKTYLSRSRYVLNWLNILKQTSIIIPCQLGLSQIGCINNKITQIENLPHTLQIAIDYDLIPYYQIINQYSLDMNDIFSLSKLSSIKLYCYCICNCIDTPTCDIYLSLEQFSKIIGSKTMLYKGLNQKHIKPIQEDFKKLENNNSNVNIVIHPVKTNGKAKVIHIHAVKKIPILESDENSLNENEFNIKSLPNEIQNAIYFIRDDCHGAMSLIQNYLIEDQKNDFYNFKLLYKHLLEHKKNNPEESKSALGYYTGKKLKHRFSNIDEEIKKIDKQIRNDFSKSTSSLFEEQQTIEKKKSSDEFIRMQEEALALEHEKRMKEYRKNNSDEIKLKFDKRKQAVNAIAQDLSQTINNMK